MIQEIFDASAVYCSIPDYKILGIKQAPFKFRLDKLSSDFKECFEVFVRSTYDPLDLKSEVSKFCIVNIYLFMNHILLVKPLICFKIVV